MSDTPRMKAAQMAAIEHGTGNVYRVGCDIERELNAAQQRIKRLEEAGDAVEERLGCGCGCGGPCRACRSESENWFKAKEAKP